LKLPQATSKLAILKDVIVPPAVTPVLGIVEKAESRYTTGSKEAPT
jgi:hypothetical protein